jgi:YVTN family beta-propeller protein
MLLRQVATTLFLCGSVFLLSSCGPKSNNQQKYGFEVVTSACTGDSGALPYNVCLPGPNRKIPNIPISGSNPKDTLDPFGDDVSHGSVTNFGFTVYGDPDVSTDQNGIALISDGRVPASWDIYWLMPWECGRTNYIDQIYRDGAYWSEYEVKAYSIANYYQYPVSGTVPVTCYQYNALPAASTRFAILGSLPNTLTLTSEAPLTEAHGMPLLYVYDKTGSVVITETATSVSSDGTQAVFPFPTSLAQSGYSLALVNQTGEQPAYSPAGTNLLSIAQSQTISGNPFGVAVGAQTTETINCVFVPEGTPPHVVITTQCSQSSSNPNAIPVVTLYSANQALIGSAHVNVGANPTAVATYTANAITNTVNNSNGYTITILSGSLRAIVANSGSNTVTILDTSANAPVATVTVGNNPVALAVSSDGTAGYVANYTDSTVTKVNLSTNTPATTVPIMGKPTSVTLTSGGTLWVGGAGFLEKINTSNMTVVGTETVPSRSIIALSYSDSLGQLIVQSTDTAGAVYQDEMSPTSFTAGGTYAALASHTVSSLGSYTVGSGRVRAFTSALSSSSSLPISLPGAPPLVVQDGWAVVTATPTGFSITDASGHLVLVSETTPSPIAAIAVDPNLNIAYLTEPDSNTLLTVPLPGTGSN